MENRLLILLLLACRVALAQLPIVAVPAASAGSSDVASGLVHRWKFDEGSGTTAADSGTPGGSTGTITTPGGSLGSLTWTSGILGGALQELVAGGQYIQLSANTAVSGALTITAWVKPGGTILGPVLYDSDNDTSAGFWFEYSTANSLNVLFNAVGSTTDCVRATPASTLTIGTWTHIAVTWDGTINDATHIHIYVNGSESSYASSSNGSGTHTANTDNNRYIGATPAINPSWNGTVDDIRLYNRALSPTEIVTVYNAR